MTTERSSVDNYRKSMLAGGVPTNVVGMIQAALAKVTHA